MAHYSENEKQRLLSFPLGDLLSAFGKRADHKGYMYYSPFREESSPSFHIDSATNRWFDFGTSEGGGVVELVCRLQGCERSEVLDILAHLDTNFVHVEPVRAVDLSAARTPSKAVTINSVSDRIQRYALLEYGIGERGVPQNILEKFCKQISYSLAGKKDSEYFAIGFQNNSGGWVLRSSRMKICTSCDITTLDRKGHGSQSPSDGTAYVFEGFFDMLAWNALFGSGSIDGDICVLNSVSNWKRAIPWLEQHDRIHFCLDNDEAGRKTLGDIINTIKEKNINPETWDMSPTYAKFKDVGQMLQSISPACQTKLTPK